MTRRGIISGEPISPEYYTPGSQSLRLYDPAESLITPGNQQNEFYIFQYVKF